jgi:hypothetical protein
VVVLLLARVLVLVLVLVHLLDRLVLVLARRAPAAAAR